MRMPNGFSSVWRVFLKASVSFCAIFGALCKDFNISGGAAKLPLIFFCFLLASCPPLTIDSTHRCIPLKLPSSSGAAQESLKPRISAE